MELNKENAKKILIIITFGIGLYWLLNNISGITGFIINLFGLMFPFILGGCIAFILNIPMTKIENWLKKRKTRLPVRITSILISLIIFIGIILLICFLLIPELIESIQLLIDNLPDFISDMQNWLLKLVDRYPEIQQRIEELFADNSNVNNIMITVLDYVVNGSLSFISGLLSSLFVVFTAVIFAVYMLSQKEYLQRGTKKLMYAYMKKEYANKLMNIGSLANKSFSKFISGQCVEALILGIIFLIVLFILKFPYALIISVLVTITAFIPMFGAMIAMLIGALLIAVTNPVQSIFFIIVFQIIQQIENNFIYPKVVGKSVGLSSIWVLLAIILGGSLMGITGMIIGLPLASILYAIIRDETNERLKNKKIKI